MLWTFDLEGNVKQSKAIDIDTMAQGARVSPRNICNWYSIPGCKYPSVIDIQFFCLWDPRWSCERRLCCGKHGLVGPVSGWRPGFCKKCERILFHYDADQGFSTKIDTIPIYDTNDQILSFFFWQFCLMMITTTRTFGSWSWTPTWKWSGRRSTESATVPTSSLTLSWIGWLQKNTNTEDKTSATETLWLVVTLLLALSTGTTWR